MGTVTEVWSNADIINTALLVVTTLGVIAAFWQIRASARAQRATFLKDLYMQLRTDASVARAFYMIEYSEFKYDGDFHGTQDEKDIDRLLTLIDLVCEMRNQSIISKREFEFFRYQFRRVAGDSHIRNYLIFLDGFYKLNGVNRRAFPAFQAFAQSSIWKSDEMPGGDLKDSKNTAQRHQ